MERLYVKVEKGKAHIVYRDKVYIKPGTPFLQELFDKLAEILKDDEKVEVSGFPLFGAQFIKGNVKISISNVPVDDIEKAISLARIMAEDIMNEFDTSKEITVRTTWP